MRLSCSGCQGPIDGPWDDEEEDSKLRTGFVTAGLLLVVLIAYLTACAPHVRPKYPVISTLPPSYIWVCNEHGGTTVCDAVPRLEDVPSGYECVYQSNGITACWPQMTAPREQK